LEAQPTEPVEHKSGSFRIATHSLEIAKPNSSMIPNSHKKQDENSISIPEIITQKAVISPKKMQISSRIN
jgi:hypothetical protein